MYATAHKYVHRCGADVELLPHRLSIGAHEQQAGDIHILDPVAGIKLTAVSTW